MGFIMFDYIYNSRIPQAGVRFSRFLKPEVSFVFRGYLR
ncbi:hypothetical protein JMA_00040 [Jeotgalibacillus malaysiensis]|uniref:Uncharacterized protein n=1 Tax=Jeotgalibacillus malaysiensis TaxID=1508404 RepID=A0A0B5AGZ2_9BACL|nr:hypothetical protein JMA_00040 [Jeotgalibacillus malaysiensis]